MTKNLLLLGLLLLSLPFWLPRAVGGDMSYHFVMTGSMKGAADPGAFVVVRRSDSYRIGEVVAFRRDLGEGQHMTVLHRIVGRLPDGRFRIKGDAVDVVEEVDRAQIKGRMVASIPGVGFLPGAFRRAPLLIGGMLLGLFFMAGRPTPKPAASSGAGSLFGAALLALLVSFPFATLGLAAFLGKVAAYGLLSSVVAATRMAEVSGVDRRAMPLLDVTYVLVVVMSLSSVSIPSVIQSARALV